MDKVKMSLDTIEDETSRLFNFGTEVETKYLTLIDDEIT
jgi:hypothetical protein